MKETVDLSNNKCTWPSCRCSQPISNNCKGLEKSIDKNPKDKNYSGCRWPNCDCSYPIKDHCAAIKK